MSEARRYWPVRPANLDDAEEVNRLLETSYATLLSRDYSPDKLDQVLPLITQAQESLLTSGTWYVATHPETQQIVGCGGWTCHSPVTEKDPVESNPPHLRHFATEPTLARQGIGQAIWQRILQDSVAHFGEEPTFDVFSTRTAVPFYASLGFQTNDQMQHVRLGEVDFPIVCMQRKAPLKLK